MDGRSLAQALHDLAHAVRETGRTLPKNRTLAAAVRDQGGDGKASSWPTSSRKRV